MRDSKAIQGAATAVTLGAVLVMGFTWRGTVSPGIQPEPHRASGWVLARQARSMLGPGGRLVVLTRDTAEYKNPASDLQLEAFKRELCKPLCAAMIVQPLQLDPLRPVQAPSGDYLEWIRKLPSGSVLVSFVGPPVLNAEQRRQLGQINPAILAFCPGNWPERVDLRWLFEQGLLRAAVVSRPQSAATAKPKGLQAWFDRDFALITSAPQ